MDRKDDYSDENKRTSGNPNVLVVKILIKLKTVYYLKKCRNCDKRRFQGEVMPKLQAKEIFIEKVVYHWFNEVYQEQSKPA